MMRALWTAASGMTSQQTNVDVIANNLSNINTIGFKGETAQFKTLLYQTIQSKTTSANGETKPVGAQVGLGTRNASITTDFSQGSLTQTDITTDFAIDGKGFFTIQNIDGETIFTRDGSFSWAIGNEPESVMLCTTEGYPVLDTMGQPIVISGDYISDVFSNLEVEEGEDPEVFDPADFSSSNITIDAEGNVCYPDSKNNPRPLDIKIGIVQFSNPGGLEKSSRSTYKMTEASGEPIMEDDSPTIKRSKVRQGYLEASNVQTVDEMVNLIVAQRAYEMNSKAIQSADEMLGQANQLKR